ncbi:NUDIX hydrolase [Streptomyces sp. NPDC058953]|uniref:NUDIX hydrolase n=1 Tax=unclassified Streptomyces TaxID=2593676 RepID=UPI003682E8DD
MNSVALAVITHQDRVLLVRRREPEGRLLWQFPGGKAEPGETPDTTAARETREETGLTVVPSAVLGERHHPETGRHLIYLACAVVRGTDTTARVTAPREIDAAVWASYDDLDRHIPHGVFAPVRRYLQCSAKPPIKKESAMIDIPPPRTQTLAPTATTASSSTSHTHTARRAVQPGMADCKHQWVGWSGKMRCRLCGATQQQ